MGTKTAKHLPLSLGVQAALEVLALPTQEECDMLQPSQAKLSQAWLLYRASSTLYMLLFFWSPGYQAPVVLDKCMLTACGKALAERYSACTLQTNSCSRGLTA